MYILICVVLSAFYIYLAVAKFFLKSKKWAKICGLISLSSAACGAALLVAGITSALTKLSKSAEELKDGNTEWASDVFSGYLKDVLPVFAIVAVLLLLSTLIQPKKMFLRSVLTSASSVLSIVHGYITLLLTDNGTLAVSSEIKMISVSLSLLLTLFCFFDFRRLDKDISEEKKKENNKKRRKAE